MICDDCKIRTFPPNQPPGRCKACTGITQTWQQKLCTNCSDDRKLCQYCQKSLDNAPPALQTLIPRGQLFLGLGQADNGKKAPKTIKVGTYILLKLPTTGYYMTWQFSQNVDQSVIKLERVIKVPGAQWGQPGQTYVIMRSVGSGNLDLELQEGYERSWWYGGGGFAPNGKKFKVKLVVKA